MRSRVLTLLKGAFLVFLGVVILVYYFQNQEDLHQAVQRYSLSTLAWVVLCMFTGYGILGVLWSPFVYAFTGARVTPLQAFSVSALSWMGRYLPGKVWMIGIRAYLSRAEGLNMKRVSFVSLLEAIFFQIAGVLLIMVAYFFIPKELDLLPVPISIIAVMGIVFLFVIHPNFWRIPVQSVFSYFGREVPSFEYRYSIILAVLVGYIIVYLFWSFAFLMLCPLESGMSVEYFPSIALMLVFAWISGFLVLIAPAGIGVRDVILAGGVVQLLGAEMVDAVAIVGIFRLLVTITELLCAAVGAAVLWMELPIIRKYFSESSIPKSS